MKSQGDSTTPKRIYRSFRQNGLLITSHAQERAQERTSIVGPNELAECASLALTEGIDAWADPTLREMLEPRVRNYNCSGVYVYEGVAYFFSEDALTTVMPIAWLAIYFESI
jgi:hypothetical protein